MTTPEIIAEIDAMTIIDSGDFDPLERLDILADELAKNTDAHLACASLIRLLERHPHVEFGTPGEPVHTLEKHPRYYEALLMQSLNRQPTLMTVWMLNRMVNGVDGRAKETLIHALRAAATHPKADSQAKALADEFLMHQVGK